MDTPYTPIACALHDRLELAAIRGREVLVAYREGGEARDMALRIVNIRVEGGEEWLVTEPPTEIRLDRILALDGESFSAGC